MDRIGSSRKQVINTKEELEPVLSPSNDWKEVRWMTIHYDLYASIVKKATNPGTQIGGDRKKEVWHVEFDQRHLIYQGQ